MAEAVVAVVAAGSTVGTVAVAVVGLVPEAVLRAVVSATEPTCGRAPVTATAAAAAAGNPLAMTPLAVRAALRAAGEVEGRGEAEAAGISILWASL